MPMNRLDLLVIRSRGNGHLQFGIGTNLSSPVQCHGCLTWMKIQMNFIMYMAMKHIGKLQMKWKMNSRYDFTSHLSQSLFPINDLFHMVSTILHNYTPLFCKHKHYTYRHRYFNTNFHWLIQMLYTLVPLHAGTQEIKFLNGRNVNAWTLQIQDIAQDANGDTFMSNVL